MSLSELQSRARFVQSSAASAGVHFDEERWLSRVRQSLEREAAEALGAAAKVFDVPRVLRATKPEAYVPQHFALGPYHCHRAELRDMERYKLAAAKRAEMLFAGGRKFDHLAQRLLGLQDKMRGPYHRFLDLSDETLAWMIAIDTCFLLDFLEGYHRSDATDMVSSATTWINATVRDAMMLENQLPLFLFAHALSLRLPQHASSEQAAAEALHAVLARFIREVSPIKTAAAAELLPIAADVCRRAHMLELLYHFLVPSAAVFDEDCSDPPPLMVPDEFTFTVDMLSDDPAQHLPPEYDKVKQACAGVSGLDVAPIRFIRTNLISRPMSLASSLPGHIMRKIPALSALAPLLRNLMASTDVEARLKGVNLGSIINSPLAQEIMIPSVAELARSGVTFAPAPDGIAGIVFDPETATLRLPVITLDANTEVVLRNLVAYEAVAVRGPLVLARYTELMNGVVDAPEDVKILRRAGVVVNQLKSDKEAADMWNGMCRAARLSRVPRLDAVIREVNAYRSRRAAARVRRMINKYVFRSWRVLTLLAALVLLLMTAMQTFCLVYPCQRWFGNLIPLPATPGGPS
ncbi:hypothetical protein PR202_ga30620 [Eleusine coracana subsp. coracana]|uniref:Uncharacterized protein n=1 Tax=Eleusine coracana subsp. coracana TaxID=191504 RepID=A0AAV5DPS5_ELECO|nr:hypothetical protein QOZ80_8AG0618790 [Eleusine coracana subsp. coracana]GJN12349.1 hypothetical protein PR202_ga30620 [Eleusine coracana subsp. coracana]